MSQIEAAPLALTDRISQLDIIRGFALFGVLLMNLYGHNEFALPEARIEALSTAEIDRPLGFLFSWLVDGKAQALFSMLFGFGFAMFLERAEARGASGMRLYVRRLLILTVIGFAHMWLVFYGDILHAYALVGFVLLLMRKWPSWALLTFGIILSLVSSVVFGAHVEWVEATTGSPPAVITAWEEGMVRRYDLLLDNDAAAYVGELFRGSGDEWFFSLFAWTYFATVLGRFLIGFWLFRQGWLRRPAEYAEGFRRWAPRLLIVGLVTAGADAGLGLLDPDLNTAGEIASEMLHKAAQVLLALGYGAGLVLLLQRIRWQGGLSGLGAVGRMALTNYLMQSLVYLFVFYGFGLGLMRYGGALTCLLIAVPAFAAQILFSQWWLARYRFGPAEWLWRSATYGQWQPFSIKLPESASVTP